jgi:hypothetical protein
MRPLAGLAAALICALATSCGRETPQGPAPDTRLQVYVHWGDMGVADRRIVVVELGVEKPTDAGGIAEFLLPAGTYTLRAYGINTLGPPPLYVSLTVTTIKGETRRVEVEDCLPCDAAQQAD